MYFIYYVHFQTNRVKKEELSYIFPFFSQYHCKKYFVKTLLNLAYIDCKLKRSITLLKSISKNISKSIIKTLKSTINSSVLKKIGIILQIRYVSQINETLIEI